MKNTVRTKIISLVENTSDDQFLDQIHSILDSRLNFKNGELFEQLTDSQKSETLFSIDVSNDAEQLVSNYQLKKDIQKRVWMELTYNVLPSSGFGLRASASRLPTSVFPLPTSHNFTFPQSTFETHLSSKIQTFTNFAP